MSQSNCDKPSNLDVNAHFGTSKWTKKKQKIKKLKTFKGLPISNYK
jgi:hypothetical protein